MAADYKSLALGFFGGGVRVRIIPSCKTDVTRVRPANSSRENLKIYAVLRGGIRDVRSTFGTNRNSTRGNFSANAESKILSKNNAVDVEKTSDPSLITSIMGTAWLGKPSNPASSAARIAMTSSGVGSVAEKSNPSVSSAFTRLTATQRKRPRVSALWGVAIFEVQLEEGVSSAGIMMRPADEYNRPSFMRNRIARASFVHMAFIKEAFMRIALGVGRSAVARVLLQARPQSSADARMGSLFRRNS